MSIKVAITQMQQPRADIQGESNKRA